MKIDIFDKFEILSAWADKKEKQEGNTLRDVKLFLFAFDILIISILIGFKILANFKFASNAMGRLVNRDRYMSNSKEKENMDAFITIRFKRETAKRFQQFSKTHYKTHTDAMAGMLDFFFYNEISPKENFGPSVRTIESLIKKRINGLIAIIKDIEKNQTKPTAAMLLSLLEQETDKKPLLIEKKRLLQTEINQTNKNMK